MNTLKYGLHFICRVEQASECDLIFASRWEKKWFKSPKSIILQLQVDVIAPSSRPFPAENKTKQNETLFTVFFKIKMLFYSLDIPA